MHTSVTPTSPLSKDNPLDEWVLRYQGDCELFAREVLGFIADDWQREVMRDYDQHARGISVRSGHGVGKSAVVAIIIIHHILFRFPQKTAVTAPTKDQLFDVLVPEVKGWIGQLPPTLRMLLVVKTESIELAREPDLSFITFKVSRPENPEALAGVHSQHVLLIADEASGVHEKIFEAASGSMSAEKATTILTGNPVRTSGLFFDTHHNKAGSHYRVHHVSCITSKRVARAFIEEIAARYGVDSNQYRVRILGEFPKADDDTIIPFELVEGAKLRDVLAIEVQPVWGLDVARFGQDASALARRKGNVLQGIETWHQKSNMELAGIIKSQYENTAPEDRPSEIVVDSIGHGSGVVDRLMEMGLPAAGLNVSESPAFKELYADLRTELWFKAREWFNKRDVSLGWVEGMSMESPLGNLLAQLPALKFRFLSTGKMRAESKDDLKKRDTKMGSPDEADAFMLTMAREAVSALYGSAKPHRKARWDKPQKRNIKGIV